MTKYKITIEIESKDVIPADLDTECKVLQDEFLESDIYNLKNIKVDWEEVK